MMEHVDSKGLFHGHWALPGNFEGEGELYAGPGNVGWRKPSESGPATADEVDRLAPAHKELPQMASPPSRLGGMIEIEVSGARIRVEPGVEIATLSTVLSVLRGIR